MFNDIYSIIFDGVGCVWSDEWKPGAELDNNRNYYGSQIKTHLTVRDAGGITAAAGTFDSCVEVSLDVKGLTDGLAYRGGKKEYYFAPGIGIVRMVSHFAENEPPAVYELTEYSGIGEGMMPLGGGFMRRYDAVVPTDGYEAWTNYYYEKDPMAGP